MSKKTGFSFMIKVIFILFAFTIPITFLYAENKTEKPKATSDIKVVAEAIKIESGLISGKTIGETGKEVQAYLGIPYAAPPVGDLRWKPPQPVVSWSGVRDCTQYSKTAVQGEGSPFDFFPQDEDCLYLNVITPAKNANEKLPVMVWFHGGGYAWGSGNNPLNNNHRLPQQGVIVVTVNMRLDIFGLLAHPLLSAESDRGVSGNYMFLDMLESLEWIKKNIAAFGGDPDNVTIFGESSGGMKVAILIASPLSKGLLKRAICQSGPAVPGQAQALYNLEKNGNQFFNQLGVKTLEAARLIPWQDIKKLSADAICMPALDGWIINDDPAKIFTAGKQNPVQMLVGLNQGELGEGKMSSKDGAAMVVSAYVNMLSGIRKPGLDGFAYIFDQVPVNWRIKGGKAVHALDLFYVFGDYDHKTTEDWPLMYDQESYYGIGPEDKEPVMTETDKKVSEEMMNIWAQFAKTGNPSVKGLITVPAWEPDTDKYLYIAEPLQIKSGFSALASASENIAGPSQGKQEGNSLPLNATPYEKITLSKKDMDRLLGTWLGKPVLPQGTQFSGEIPTYLFRFETTETGDFKGSFETPEMVQQPTPIINIDVNDNIFNFKGLFIEFKGKLSDNEIVGELKYPDEMKVPTLSLTLKKGEYVAQTYKLSLPKDTIDQLLGKWNGQLTIQEVSMTLGFRFEMTEDGTLVGFIDFSDHLSDQGIKGIPVTKADLTDEKLTLISFFSEYKGQLSGDKIMGDFTQWSISSPLLLTKEKP